MNIGEGYLEKIKTRRKQASRISKPYQLIGLEIADILGDRRHKALYIKMAKEMNAIELLRIAKDVADRHAVKSRGAYFMSIVTGEKEAPTPTRAPLIPPALREAILKAEAKARQQ